MKKLNTYEFFLFNNVFIFLFLLIYLLGLKIANKKNNIEIKKIIDLNRKELIALLIGAFVSLVGAILFLFLIKMDNVTTIMSLSQSLSIIASLLVGFMFFSEHIKPKDIFGILLIVFGVTIIKYK
tara:strand:+ start:2746 stop:3120 length:375 start_codon:yes stop_codon:yes gene_type:complete